MTDPNLLPAQLRSWAENTLGPLTAVRRLPPGSSPVAVWHVVRGSDNARFHLKTAPSPGAFTRETFAYRHAVPALGSGNAPRLVATSARHLAMILTALPGTPLQQAQLTDTALKTVHWRAGMLVAELHQAGRPTTTARHDASALLSRLADTAARHADAAGDQLSAEDQKFVMALADHLRVLDRLPLGFIHGGGIEAGLRWSGTSRPALQDFDRARFAPVVVDFVHLAYGLWAERPPVRTAFFDGYGRALGAEERQALRCLTGLHAVRSLAESLDRADRADRTDRADQADQAAADTARTVLDRLKSDLRGGAW
ncbi:aminoglycoside phosphotransferase family protein [Streptomyces sp. W16]|uniref:aminoglycoside phosphotransferase family protein n=1 Tax=Streptomyces sp. W16 TaxID=3076631 RepID=UPI00295B6851|nr:phosphotransferase [Streptomyces sp. W16]MDV9168930.1 aminoglycoside phosphotransferase family protein [Streptomyces sp. W16]